jgi:hypothetical protein
MASIGRINTHIQSPPSPAHLTPPSSRSISPFSSLEDERPHNKSVMFAPLSPTSSRRLDRIHTSKSNPTAPNSGTYHPPTNDYADDQVYDDPSSPERERSHHRHHHRSSDDEETGHKRRRHRRRNSDPSSDRPNQPSKHRRRNKNASRSSSPASSDVEDLPPRFDRHGRPLDETRGGGGGQGEMVEKIMHDFGDVVDGRKTWKDLLVGLMESGGLGALGGGGGSGSDRESGSRKKRRN